MGLSQAFSPSSGLVFDSCLNRNFAACMMDRTAKPAPNVTKDGDRP